MAQDGIKHFTRRRALQQGALLTGALALDRARVLQAQNLRGIEVASAGSFRAMLDGPLKTSAATELHLEIRSHSQGADAVARSITDGSLQADLFIPITPGPMLTVLRAGKAQVAYPIARTEMVILYSAKSRFQSQFAAAADGKENWWKVLQEPGLRFARSNPLDDPSGRSVIFTMMLAAAKYGQPDLVQKVLGPLLNPAQLELGKNARTGLEDGTVDAVGSYRIATGLGKLPFITLPDDVNLSSLHVRQEHPHLSLSVGEKTFYPEPLVFYAATLSGSTKVDEAGRFLTWLRGKQVAGLLQANGFALPEGATPLDASTSGL